MVPQVFHDYFVASTGAGAALLGLLFVAVSIAPERTVMSTAPVERQAAATSAYTALLNAFFLSLVALLPHTNLGSAALVVSLIGLANSFILAWNLSRHTERRWLSIIRRAVFILAGLLLYGEELYNAILLLLAPTNSAPISLLAAVLVGIYALGMTRAWQLLGGRGRQLHDWLTPLRETEERQAVTEGVFSLRAMEELSNAENVHSVLGTVRGIHASDTTVRVESEYDGKMKHDEYEYVVVARGFDVLWFRHLLDAITQARMAEGTHSFDGRTSEHAITEDLSLDGFIPKFHLPMLAGIAQGPGFPNLSCLGLLADRILASY